MSYLKRVRVVVLANEHFSLNSGSIVYRLTFQQLQFELTSLVDQETVKEPCGFQSEAATHLPHMVEALYCPLYDVRQAGKLQITFY